jgi:hypothetical protein
MHKFERRITRLEGVLGAEQLSPAAQGQGMLGLLRLVETYGAEAAPWEEEADETEEDPEALTGLCRLLWEQRQGR